MFAELFSFIGKALVGIALSFASLFGYTEPVPSVPQPDPVPVAAIQGAADYSSSLASQISAAATTLTVVSTSTASGEYLVPGRTYGLKLGGREYVIGTLASSGRQFTNLIRGVSTITGTTTAATAEIWGRGTSVEITDAPILLEVSNKLSGLQGFDTLLYYIGGTACSAASASTSICHKGYYDNLIAQGAATSTESVAGIVRLATSAQAASSTNLGANDPLALHSLIATSSPYTIGNWVPITDDDGKLNQTFWRLGDSFTWGGSHIFNGSVALNGIVSGNVIVASSTPASVTVNFRGTSPQDWNGGDAFCDGGFNASAIGSNLRISKDGTVADAECALTSAFAIASTTPAFSMNPIFTATASTTPNNAYTDSCYVLMGTIGGTTLSATANKHIGFRLRNNLGASEIYIVNGNGSSQTSTLVTGAGINTKNTLTMSAIQRGTTAIDFFINGTKVGTHTTNIPTGAFTNDTNIQFYFDGESGGTGSGSATCSFSDASLIIGR